MRIFAPPFEISRMRQTQPSSPSMKILAGRSTACRGCLLSIRLHSSAARLPSLEWPPSRRLPSSDAKTASAITGRSSGGHLGARAPRRSESWGDDRPVVKQKTGPRCGWGLCLVRKGSRVSAGLPSGFTSGRAARASRAFPNRSRAGFPVRPGRDNTACHGNPSGGNDGSRASALSQGLPWIARPFEDRLEL